MPKYLLKVSYTGGRSEGGCEGWRIETARRSHDIGAKPGREARVLLLRVR